MRLFPTRSVPQPSSNNALAFFQIERVQALSNPVVDRRGRSCARHACPDPARAARGLRGPPKSWLAARGRFRARVRNSLRLFRNALQTHISTTRSADPDPDCARVNGVRARAMSETRKIAAILVADVVGYSRLAAADEDRALARLRGLRSV